MMTAIKGMLTGLFYTILAIVLGLALLVMLIYAIPAFAHPVDELCVPPKLHTEDGCQPIVRSLQLDNEEVYHAHKAYWHCRRELVSEDLMQLGACLGAAKSLSVLLGESYQETIPETALREYWNVIPAHPELDALDTGDVSQIVARADAQREACEITRAIAGAVIWGCQWKQQGLEARVLAGLRKPPPVCSKPPARRPTRR